VSGKSVQKEVQQRERTITHIYDHELAAELGRSSDVLVVRIEGGRPFEPWACPPRARPAGKSALLKPLTRPLELILPSFDSIIACAAVQA
jgi:hypothetical protein